MDYFRVISICYIIMFKLKDLIQFPRFLPSGLRGFSCRSELASQPYLLVKYLAGTAWSERSLHTFILFSHERGRGQDVRQRATDSFLALTDAFTGPTLR